MKNSFMNYLLCILSFNITSVSMKFKENVSIITNLETLIETGISNRNTAEPMGEMFIPVPLSSLTFLELV